MPKKNEMNQNNKLNQDIFNIDKRKVKKFNPNKGSIEKKNKKSMKKKSNVEKELDIDVLELSDIKKPDKA